MLQVVFQCIFVVGFICEFLASWSKHLIWIMNQITARIGRWNTIIIAVTVRNSREEPLSKINKQKLIKYNTAKHLSQMILFRYFSRHKQNPRMELISGSHFLTSQMQKRLRLLIFEAQHAIVTHFLFCLSKADTFLSKCKAAKKYNQLSAGNHSHTKFGKALLRNLVTASLTGGALWPIWYCASFRDKEIPKSSI